MLLIGLAFRRVWTVPLGGLAWGVLLLAMGLISVGELPFASLVGGANFAVGVLVHRLVAWPWRALRPDGEEPSSVGV
jgi:hypothetical protein